MAVTRIECPACSKYFSIDSEFFGKTALCPHCRKRVIVPLLNVEMPPIDPIPPPVQGQSSFVDLSHYVDHFEYEAVGESNYQAALWRNVSRDHHSNKATETVAVIIAEPTNAYDREAVRIDIRGETVGYLSRSEARSLRRIADADQLSQGIAVSAVILGGFTQRDGSIAYLGVRLNLSHVFIATPSHMELPTYVKGHKSYDEYPIVSLFIVLVFAGVVLYLAWSSGYLRTAN